MASFDKGKYILSEDSYLNLCKTHQYDIKVHHRFKKLLFYNELFFSAEQVLNNSQRNTIRGHF